MNPEEGIINLKKCVISRRYRSNAKNVRAGGMVWVELKTIKTTRRMVNEDKLNVHRRVS